MKCLLRVAIGGALGVIAPPSLAGPVVNNRAVEIVGSGATSDPLIAVEANRDAIVNRLVAEHAATLPAIGVSVEAFRSALESLRADQLLAASLVNSVAEITAIVSEAPVNGSVLQRFIALTPRDASAMRDLPIAEAYLVREGGALTIVRAAELQSATQVVGYFAPVINTVVVNSTARDVTPKDGSGSGASSWIGYVAGNNQATGSGSAVAAGTFNLASGQGSFVGAGTSNQANGISSLVIGGFDNRAVAIDSLVASGAGNRATGARSVVVGGGYNLASGQWSFVGGGGRESGSGAAGTSPEDNVAAGNWSTIGGGQGNRTGSAANPGTTSHTTVAGGNSNTATGFVASVGGGYGNTASGYATSVDGGSGNTASGDWATVGGGANSIASGYLATVAGGTSNAATGSFSFVGGGYFNSASGITSVALGRNARAQRDGCFVWSDGSGVNPTSCFANNEFVARAGGGFYFWTSGTNDGNYAGARLAANTGAWTAYSDRNGKDNIEPVDPRAVLEKLASVPIATWRWKNEDPSHRHMGPMAQDFFAAFGLGADDTHIVTVDSDGVALAAIQGLHQVMQEKDAEIAVLKVKAEIQERGMAELRRAVQLLLARASVK